MNRISKIISIIAFILVAVIFFKGYIINYNNSRLVDGLIFSKIERSAENGFIFEYEIQFADTTGKLYIITETSQNDHTNIGDSINILLNTKNPEISTIPIRSYIKFKFNI